MSKPLHNFQIMGVLNITPDSFSDGGQFNSFSQALDQAAKLVKEGADILDIGGESTRPGAQPVSISEELDRVIPILEACKKRFPVQLSIDTYKSEVAREALKAGATILNDVTGGRDPQMISLFSSGITFILMHMKGNPQTMQDNTEYPGGVVEEIYQYLKSRKQSYVAAGVPAENIWLDPGIGFGKTMEQDLQLINQIKKFSDLGKIVLGTSRKKFLGKLLNEVNPKDRLEGTLATSLWGLLNGASIFRVHDVGSLRKLFLTYDAIEKSSNWPRQ